MTSSVQSVLKEDGVTPADPFDRGAGSIRANRAASPTITFDVTAAEYLASATDPLNRIHLNLPSVNAPPMPGLVTTSRTFKNVTGTQQPLNVSATSSSGTSIDVEPKTVTVGAGETATINITIDATCRSERSVLRPDHARSEQAGLQRRRSARGVPQGSGSDVAGPLVHADDYRSGGASADCVVEAQNLSAGSGSNESDRRGSAERSVDDSERLGSVASRAGTGSPGTGR